MIRCQGKIGKKSKQKYNNKQDYTKESRDEKATIYYFSLTTCSHCKRGLKWMRDRGVAFRWLEIDLLDLEKKNAIKKWVQKRYNTKSRMASPFVIFRFPDRDFISNGFDPDYWKAKAR